MTDIPRDFSARFAANWLPVLRPFMRGSDYPETFASLNLEGIHIEAHPDGGVVLMACNRSMIAFAHDPAGHASHSMRFTLPSYFLDAASPIRPPAFFQEGQKIDGPDMPAFLKPGDVYLSWAGAFMTTDDDTFEGVLAHAIAEGGNCYRLGEEYRLYGESVPLLKNLPAEQIPLPPTLTIGPWTLSRLNQAATALDATSMSLWRSERDPNSPIAVRFTNYRNDAQRLIALVMPMRAVQPADPLPDWATALLQAQTEKQP